MNHVTVIGLGRIGLPIALLLEKSGFQVTGVDTNKRHLHAIKTKTLHIDEPDIAALFRASKIPVSTQSSSSDIFLICVPTPLTLEKQADLSQVQGAISMIQPFLKKENLVVIESTCPIGTTNEAASHYPGIHFAYCPERVMPGNLLKELTECDRIIGGVDSNATKKAVSFYSRFCRGNLHQTEAKMAEAIKLAENAYRDVNIALANELSMLARKMNLSYQELISYANCHPRVNILSPGPGVGGHCIPIDPQFLIQAFPQDTTLLQAARAVNEEKRRWVEEDIEKNIQKHSCRTIALFGLTYRANISDFRNSPAFAIYESLRKKYRVIPVDPFYPEGILLQEGIKEAEMVIGLVAHDVFHVVNKDSLQGKIILDYAEVFS